MALLCSSVSSAGDVNGDGLDDLIVGAYFADCWLYQTQHKIYLNCCHLDQHTQHPQSNDYSGSSVSSAGDVNGDGLDDLIVGAYFDCCHLDQHTQHPQSNHPSHHH
jgi:hypothetical protein